jgi:hypothetical protein
MLNIVKLDTAALIKAALTSLHRHTFSNQDEIRRSVACHCFRCRAEFHRLDVTRWAVRTWLGRQVLSGPQPFDTAECPKCGECTVLGDACGVEVTPALLKALDQFHTYAKYDRQFDYSWVPQAEPTKEGIATGPALGRKRAPARTRPLPPGPRKKAATPPAPPAPAIPMSGYLRFKAARFLRDGHELYRRTDEFRQPPEDTSAEDLQLIRGGFEQLVHGRGLEPTAPLEHLGVHGLHLLMQVAHFAPVRQQATEQGDYFLDAVVFRQTHCSREVTVFNLVPPAPLPDELRSLLECLRR